MSAHHEILGIPSIEDLQRMSDVAIKNAYDHKLRELKRIRVIEVEEEERQERLLEAAFSALKTKEKRDAYIQQLNQPQPVMIDMETKEGAIKVFTKLPAEMIDRAILAYQTYVDNKINNLDNSAPDYPQKKAELENFKKLGEPKKETHSSFEAFQESEFYQALPDKDKMNYSADNYPQKTSYTVLSFETLEEALQFTKTHMSVEFARDLATKFQEEGHVISPEVLEELKEEPQHRPVYNRR